MGLFEPAGSIAAQVLAETGVTRAQVEEQVLLASPRGSASVADPPFTPRTTASIERAATEAIGLGHNYVGTEHLLLALFGDSEGLAAVILNGLGAKRDDYANRIVHKLSGYTKPQP